MVGDDLGHGHVNVMEMGNRTEPSGTDVVAFVQLVGDRRASTVVMMGDYENHTIPYMYYHQSQRKQLQFDWLLIFPDATKNEFLQYGSFDMAFHSAEKCQNVTFDTVCQFFVLLILLICFFLLFHILVFKYFGLLSKW